MPDEPIMDVAHLGHLELLTPTPEQSLRFFVDVMGMTESGRKGDSVYLRGWDDYERYSLQLTGSKTSGMGHAAFRARSPQALQRRVEALQRSGLAEGWHEGELGHGPGFRFRDPDGHLLELYYETEWYQAPDALRPALKNQAQRIPGRGVNVRRIDHFNCLAVDVKANREFFQRTLGFRATEIIVLDDGTEAGMWLTATNKSYDFAYTREAHGVGGRFHHVTFALDSREAVLQAADIFLENGVFIETGPHKHAVQQTFFLYVYEPGGNRVEVANAGARLVLAPDWTPIIWTETERRKGQAWGLKTIDSFHTHGTPPLPEDQGKPDMIIDCHGHYTTAPSAHDHWRELQTAAFHSGAAAPAYPAISDDQIRDSVENNQLRLLRERGADLTIFSPRASAMAHHVGDDAVSQAWTRHCNDLIKRVVDLFPATFVGVCQLPQSPGMSIARSIAELERCVGELGFVGCNLNPDPSGGHWSGPPLTDRAWYPFFEKMVELDIPAMIHVSGSCNHNFHATGAHYINADTTAFMQFLEGDLFHDFPTLRFIIPHGGGAVPYHWGRYRGLADMLKRPPLAEHVMRNVFFDTCVYHQPGIDLLFRVIAVENILFGSEMVGAVRGIDPETGQYFDDTKRYIDALPIPAEDKRKVFERNARRVFPRLDAILHAQGR